MRGKSHEPRPKLQRFEALAKRLLRFLKALLRPRPRSRNNTSPKWRPPDLIGVISKLQRASDYNNALRDQVHAFLEGDTYGVVNDFDSEPGYLIIKAKIGGDPPPDFSILIGEALYHMRCALEYMVCELTYLSKRCPSRTMSFPICLNTREFAEVVDKKIGRLKKTHRTFIEREQPYNAGYDPPEADPLYLLKVASDRDRHQSWHLTAGRAVESKIEFSPPEAASRFRVVHEDFGILEKDGADVARYAILDGPPLNVNVNANVRFNVAFAEEGPCKGMNVVNTLGAMGMRTTKLINDLGQNAQWPPKTRGVNT